MVPCCAARCHLDSRVRSLLGRRDRGYEGVCKSIYSKSEDLQLTNCHDMVRLNPLDGKPLKILSVYVASWRGNDRARSDENTAYC